VQPLTSPPTRTLTQRMRTKRHALVGTASALGLLLAPLAGSAVVIAVTSSRPAAVVATQVAASPAAALPPAPTPAPAPAPSQAAPVAAAAPSPVAVQAAPVRDGRRTRAGR
jgi:phage tail sheath gpL-like